MMCMICSRRTASPKRGASSDAPTYLNLDHDHVWQPLVARVQGVGHECGAVKERRDGPYVFMSLFSARNHHFGGSMDASQGGFEDRFTHLQFVGVYPLLPRLPPMGSQRPSGAARHDAVSGWASLRAATRRPGQLGIAVGGRRAAAAATAWSASRSLAVGIRSPGPASWGRSGTCCSSSWTRARRR